MPYTKKEKRAFARRMRSQATAGEKAVRWWLLPITYRFQAYDPTGYLPDFYSSVFRVAIEVDGSAHSIKGQKQQDKQKDKVRRRNKIYTLRVSDTRARTLPISVMVEALLTGLIYRAWRLFIQVIH